MAMAYPSVRVCAALLLLVCVSASGRSLTSTGNGETVAVDFYGEALCPYCANFTSQIMKPLFENKVMSLATLTYVPYGNARYNTETDAYTCQHGPRECELNSVLSCAIDLYPGQDSWFPFVECVESSIHTVTDTAELVSKCAAAGAYTADDITACAKGGKGAELQRAAMQKTGGLRPAHQYVPWVVVNGIPLMDAYQDLGTIICAAYQGPKPDECYDLPQPSSSMRLGTVTPAVLPTRS